MKLVVTEFVSVDGVMEAPGGEPGYRHTDWVSRLAGEEEMAFKEQETVDAEAHLLGRVTYDSFAGAWPQREGRLADKINAMPKYVVSSTLRDPPWHNTTVLEGELAESIGALKAREGGTLLVVGSRTLVHALLGLGLVDELTLMVFPIILGSGFRVFPDQEDTIRLAPVESRTYPSGVALQRYRVA